MILMCFFFLLFNDLVLCNAMFICSSMICLFCLFSLRLNSDVEFHWEINHNLLESTTLSCPVRQLTKWNASWNTSRSHDLLFTVISNHMGHTKPLQHQYTTIRRSRMIYFVCQLCNDTFQTLGGDRETEICPAFDTRADFMPRGHHHHHHH